MSIREFAGRGTVVEIGADPVREEIWKAIVRLNDWLERHQFMAYDTFDGLSSKMLRPLTFETRLLRTVLLQGVRRFPLNLRPVLGIPRAQSSKGMGFLARGYLRLYRATGEQHWMDRADEFLRWLTQNRLPGYSGACWGNHFDYQSRTFYLPKNTPTVVWTSLIGHAFLDMHEQRGDAQSLDVAASSCAHIVKDLQRHEERGATCISYIPGKLSLVHNANTLAASLLARTWKFTGDTECRDLAERALKFTAMHQRDDGAWAYGPAPNLAWVDNFHTAYVLDCYKHYLDATGDERYLPVMRRGHEFWKSRFFLDDGTPRYYENKTLPLDIQCSSQAIDSFTFFHRFDSGALRRAKKVAQWTIRNMQDASGYFYYRRHSAGFVNKTPTLHWGQATMMSALAGLYLSLRNPEQA